MVRIAQKMLNNGDVAPDIVQDVFIDFYQKTSNKTVILYPKSWLARATINKTIDHLRKQKRFENTDSLKLPAEELHPFENKELIAAINLALSKLSIKEKTVAVLYSEGLSYKEIAEASGIRFSSIGSTLSRTLQKLEIELKKPHYELY